MPRSNKNDVEKVTLIQPAMGKRKSTSYVKSWSMYPLNLGVVAGLTPSEVNVDFYDDRFEENIDYDMQTDMVAMPVETYTAKRAYDISSRFRERGIPVVMGGVHATLQPGEVAGNCDSVVIGDAEPVWAQIIEDARSGNMKRIYTSKPQGKTLEHINPDRKMFSKYKYLPVDLVETGRGCYHHCDFCSIAGMYGGNYRHKDIGDIIEDVKSIEGKNIYFVDDNFVSDPKKAKELCEQLNPLNKRWSSQGSVNMANDSELLKAMADSGCINMLIGFESLNSDTLKQMGKTWAIARRDYTETIKKVRDAGITLYSTFVFGYPGDKKEDFQRTLDFAMDQKFAIAAFNFLVPFPGTPLMSRLKDEGKLKHDKWWLEDDLNFGDVVFNPENMTSEELAEGCFSTRKKFYSFPSMFKRLVDPKANAKSIPKLFYTSYINLFSGREHQKRQGWPIGREE